jgi:hypothetical protein
MQLEIDPEPTPEEREAIAAAVAALIGDEGELPSWWQAGVRESLEEAQQDEES